MLFIICWSVVIALLLTVVYCKEESLYIPGPVDCAKFKVGKQLIDLSRVNKEWSVTFEKSDYTLRFNPCAPLKGHQTSCPKGSKMCLFEGGSSDSGTAAAVFGDHVAYAVVHKSVPQIVLVIGQSSLSSDRFPFVGLVRITCPEDDGDSDEEYTRRHRHGNKKNTPYLSEEHSPFYQVSIMDKSVCRLYEEEESKVLLSEYAWITANYRMVIR